MVWCHAVTVYREYDFAEVDPRTLRPRMELKSKLSSLDEFTLPEEVEVFPTSRGETIVLSKYIVPAADKELLDPFLPEENVDIPATEYAAVTEIAEPPPATQLKHRTHSFLRTAWNAVQLVAIGLTLGLLVGAWDELYAQGLLRNQPAFGERTNKPGAVAEYISPRFGPAAMASCSKACPAKDGTDCLNSCGRLAYTHYGRRITLTELNPTQEAEEIVASCMNLAPEKASARTRSKWQETTTPALTSLRNAQLYSSVENAIEVAKSYNELVQASSALQNAAASDGQAKAFTGLLQRALCLRAQLTQAELAISIVEANNDGVSSRFFHALRGRLGPRALEAESSAFARADELQLQYEKK